MVNTTKTREIASLAETVRESLELSIPVDMYKAVARLGGLLEEVDSLGGPEEARIKRNDERFIITIKKDQLPARKRFSIAHELGHLFLHMGYLINPDAWSRSSDYCDSVYHRYGHGIEEAEANLFAAAFLMPEAEFRDVFIKHSTQRLSSIKPVADSFKTSASAALRRAEELGLLKLNAGNKSS